MKTVLLVRHADIDLPPVGLDPLLNAKGKQRAQDLTRTLEAADIRRVFVSSAKRTQLTAKPLLQQLAGVTAEIEDNVDSLAQKILATAGNVLVVGHSNTVPEIIAKLGGAAGLPVLQGFANLFVFMREGSGPPGLVHLKYGDPRP
jgi:broad specificity phosphatase PhoE